MSSAYFRPCVSGCGGPRWRKCQSLSFLRAQNLPFRSARDLWWDFPVHFCVLLDPLGQLCPRVDRGREGGLLGRREQILLSISAHGGRARGPVEIREAVTVSTLVLVQGMDGEITKCGSGDKWPLRCGCRWAAWEEGAFVLGCRKYSPRTRACVALTCACGEPTEA